MLQAAVDEISGVQKENAGKNGGCNEQNDADGAKPRRYAPSHPAT